MMSIGLNDIWLGKNLPVNARFKNDGGCLCFRNMISQLAVNSDMHGPMAVSTGSVDSDGERRTM
jgi:hypothetical protein